MKLSHTGAVARTLLVALVVFTYPAGVWAAHQDAWLTAKTKIALATSDEVSAADVNVDTIEGRVTLHGIVPSEEAKKRAKSIAENIKGVKEVRSLLQVVATAEVEHVEARDDVIHGAVTRALANDEITSDSDIKVQSVNAGVVLLGGRANSLLQHLEAIRVTEQVDGVRQVATDVRSGDALYDEKLWHDPALRDDGATMIEGAKDAARKAGDSVEKASGKAWKGTKDAARATKDAATGAGRAVRDGAATAGEKTGDAAGRASDAVTDAWITSAIKARLIANADVPGMSVNVDTEDGVVTLFGNVPSKTAKALAEAEALEVSGVKEVRNRLETR